MWIYPCSPTLSQISLKGFLWESGFSNFCQNRYWRKIKIGYLAAILKRYNFVVVVAELWFFIIHTYMVHILSQNPGGEVVFLRGVPWNPLGHQQEWRYLDANTRRLRPIRVASKTQTRGPLNFGPCKANWPAAFVIKIARSGDGHDPK